MRADQIDIALQDRGAEIIIRLGGELQGRHLPALREKLEVLSEEGGKIYILDLHEVRFTDEVYLSFFVDLLNRINGKESRLVLLFSDESNWKYFRRFANIFTIHPSYRDWKRSGFLANLRRTGVAYSRKTGIRISTGVALLLVLLVFGWVLTLFTIIQFQERELRKREERVLGLEQEQRDYVREIAVLRRAIGPLRELGLVGDSLRTMEYESIGDWVEYLERLESRRRREQVPSEGTELP